MGNRGMLARALEGRIVFMRRTGLRDVRNLVPHSSGQGQTAIRRRPIGDPSGLAPIADSASNAPLSGVAEYCAQGSRNRAILLLLAGYASRGTHILPPLTKRDESSLSNRVDIRKTPAQRFSSRLASCTFRQECPSKTRKPHPRAISRPFRAIFCQAESREATPSRGRRREARGSPWRPRPEVSYRPLGAASAFGGNALGSLLGRDRRPLMACPYRRQCAEFSPPKFIGGLSQTVMSVPRFSNRRFRLLFYVLRFLGSAGDFSSAHCSKKRKREVDGRFYFAKSQKIEKREIDREL